MTLEESITALLENGEKQAAEKDAAIKQERTNIKTEDNENRYSAEREENDARRSRRSYNHEDSKVKDESSDSADSRRRSDRDSDRERERGRRDRDRYSRNSPRDRDRPDYYTRRPDDNYYRPSRRQELPRHGRSRSPRRSSRRGGRDDMRRRSPIRQRQPDPGMPSDEERDRRTVFVTQLAQRLRTRELKEFFEQAGPVVEAQIVRDRQSKVSKGMAYVEFKELESVEKALNLVGKKLLDIPIIVSVTESEKNRQAKTNGGAPSLHNGIPFHRLYVGNVHFGLEEAELEELFSGFGELEFVQLQRDDLGRSKGYGFVQYTDPANAKHALETLNGFVLGDRPIRVGLGSDKFTPESTAQLLNHFNNKHQGPSQTEGSSFSGAGGRGAHAGGQSYFDRAGSRNDAKVGNASALDDSDVGGVNMSNYSRHALMTSLSRSHQTDSTVKEIAKAKPAPVRTSNQPSRCLLIKNMYTAETQQEENWSQDIIEDVRDECAAKYGAAVHIDVAPDSNDGEVFVKFKEVAGAIKAYQGMNGRFYDNQTLEADYMVEAVYSAKFPKTKNL